MKITKEDLLAIKVGTSVTFQCRDGNHCEAVRQNAYRVNNIYFKRGIRLKCSIKWIPQQVVVTAIKVDVPKIERA